MRDQILAKAQQQIRGGGYASLNFGPIAESLSTTRANLHHHFGSKRGLAIEATKAYIESNLLFVAELASVWAEDFPGYLSEVESSMLAALGQLGKQSRCLCGQLVRDADVPEELDQLAKQFGKKKRQLMTDVVVASQRAGVLRPDVDPEFLSKTATALLLGIAHMADYAEDLEAFVIETEGTLASWIEPYRL